MDRSALDAGAIPSKSMLKQTSLNHPKEDFELCG
jgi:hypothetical protein